ncbi:restriction endonuclease [Amycolatopsis sp. GM8]|uniref:restriction endonuclease n=1 Tax=Amycolatopsis sp. GM8 TaxID=2896530 RepID=UPI001F2F7979|nr:restriction endonuclease [Amycolatopsis sp. GM8]
MAGKKRPEWAEYEKLAAKIIAELSPHAAVTHDDHVVGRDSEARRQIDVSARWTDGDVERLLIVQVRDYKRRSADVNVVGEFRSVIQDVRADRGILICSGGFSKNAMTYSRNIGVELYSLSDAKSKRWELELTVPTLWHRINPYVNYRSQIYVEDAPLTIQLRDDKSFPFVSLDAGSPYDFAAEFKKAWDSGELSFETGVEHEFLLEQSLAIEGVAEDGEVRVVPVRDLVVTYTVERHSYLGQLKPSDYRGLIDHLNDKRFLPSYIALDLPSLESGEWAKIEDPSRLAINVAGFFMTVEDARIDTAEFEGHNFTYVGPKAPELQ